MPPLPLHYRLQYAGPALVLCGLLASAPLHARAADEAPALSGTQAALLGSITVSGAVNDPLSPSPQAALRALQSRPGNVSLVTEEDYADRPALGLGDALAGIPGVFAQSAAGPQSAKLSIRGSGLTSPLGVRGLMLLRDGLPLNQADGTVDPSYADPFNARYIEILRGANALRYGAATLGGAINIVSPTGYSHPGLETRLQAGSYGYLQAQARAGQVFDNGLDAFASVGHFQTDGSAAHSRQKALRFYGNLGYRASEGSQGRFHVDILDMDQDVTSPLTMAQLRGDAEPDNPAPPWPERRARTHPHVRLAYQHTLSQGPDTLSLGTYYTDTTLDLLGTNVPIFYRTRDYGLALRGEMLRDLGGHENRLTWGASLARGHSNSQTYGPFVLPGGMVLDPSTEQYEAITTSAQTALFYLENSYSLTPALSVSAAMQAITAQRRRGITALRNPQALPTYFKDVDQDRRYNGFSPKLGLLWQVAPKAQIFANLSRSFEPPSTLQFYNTEGTTEAQKATTWEVGSRGSSRLVNWEAALFYSRVKDELLNIAKLGPSGETIGYQGGNIPDTRRLGLELQLHGKVSPESLTGSVHWNLSYTWSRFRHAGDTAFGNNRLPLIPRHYGQASITYRHPSGVYWGPELVFASSSYVDQANTLRAPGYGVVNFTVGYAHSSGRFRVFVNARNLADKRYAASIEQTARAGAGEAAFYSGMRRSIFAGAQILW
ncbi:TonB-dependent receptor family protein [Pusillimonas noertemannii]|uniref:TonB-dependent receptor family protein n=1 Tax=Pusillimonas noertemannii TaxID=305977 RepID=UPI0002DCEA6D|nr:TonB-dependent receptor [Pusillimonas noertemannii]